MFEYKSLPVGMHPMEATGVITQTGQAFYLCYRGGKVRLTIFKDDKVSIGASSDLVARTFETNFSWQSTFGPLDVCTAFVTGWVKEYLAEVFPTPKEITSSEWWDWIDGVEGRPSPNKERN